MSRATKRPTDPKAKRAHTHNHTHYGNSQNTQVKIAANYMRLQSSNSNGRQAGICTLLFLLLRIASASAAASVSVSASVVVVLAFGSQSAAQLFSCRFFSIALTFRSVLGKCFSRPSVRPSTHQRQTRSLFCFAAATTNCPQNHAPPTQS